MASGYKNVPTFWWDFVWLGNVLAHIAVCSDHPDYPLITTLSSDSQNEAEALIAKLKAGTVDFRRMAKEQP